jgi:hypothetical protein
MSAAMVLARIVTVEVSLPRADVRGGFWHCPNRACGRRLGEIVGERIIVAAGDRVLSSSIRENPIQTCPKCGQLSVYRDGLD